MLENETDRIARVEALAMKALGCEAGRRWLREPNTALGSKIPLEVLATDEAGQVEQIIGRIEHGLFS